jgi:hypothetical protein
VIEPFKPLIVIALEVVSPDIYIGAGAIAAVLVIAA